ncbi:peptide methionine sulfoxide reductase [Salipiger aestuarii]|uniref:Peptide methionine sulfoxide reductase MsrA n=1 Tax=Salipiger aestuarii TaxID=568098 RepID=A0A327YKA2_9RHOB|nr:peptide-methionine (S)-S-oxide reductase MsrA [Salipiger aestuarii]EIE50077.1 peptide methionine sulfoxide reductase [Citreicella sp. 357]KAA8609867.1 peptide methionine sulfoxide reductase [Salipiger aestuarii]KAA8616179.1 peptide methionine sulfoxide reductase [Salipiger aestuarii]KAB2543127.1 peptide methionine sulfoxide reductase [Salipiger aestuarii]RAK21444.1 peptide-methionine (S)-S-oxide reductase [Salipiger aestuarii]
MIRLLSIAALLCSGFSAQAAERQITVAGGCFWCVEADFEKVPGVTGAESGYTGGTLAKPSYKQVSRGGTGHYEAVRITYDDTRIAPEQLYALFFRSVDPTDAGGQFCDRGESYRTAIFAGSAAQESAARTARAKAQAELGQKIVTPILPAATFYAAEEEHQDYYRKNDIVLTRFGPTSKAKAYKKYRDACGRDERVRRLWGAGAPFAGG